jgi:hypothetical protein
MIVIAFRRLSVARVYRIGRQTLFGVRTQNLVAEEMQLQAM